MNIVLICHDTKARVPNPGGEDWIRYEPRLYHNDKNSLREMVKEWCDHVAFIGYDIAITEDGKGKGGGSRTIYVQELPTHVAKSRTLRDPIVYTEGDAAFWTQMIEGGAS